LGIVFEQFWTFLRDIKFSHSIFAFPFAVSAFFLVDLPLPTNTQLVALVVCMVAARSFAMGANRIFDRKIDLMNPRTAGRSIPAGKLKLNYAWLYFALSGVVFIASTSLLSTVALYASVPVLIFLAGYSFMKRIHYLTHIYLGLCLGLAPNAVFAALTNSFSLPLIVLGLAIAVWTAGFDILYALQDYKFDREQGLQSIPAFFGPRPAVIISRFLFGAMILLLLIVGHLTSAGVIYYLGVSFVTAGLVYEHVLLRNFYGKNTGEVDIPNIGKIFFDLNAGVSVVFMLFVVLAKYV